MCESFGGADSIFRASSKSIVYMMYSTTVHPRGRKHIHTFRFLPCCSSGLRFLLARSKRSTFSFSNAVSIASLRVLCQPFEPGCVYGQKRVEYTWMFVRVLVSRHLYLALMEIYRGQAGGPAFFHKDGVVMTSSGRRHLCACHAKQD